MAPIAVLPEYQKKGIGSALINHGHNVAFEKGYEFSLLCGHPAYYPRFGYIRNTFSIGGTEILVRDQNLTDNNPTLRPLHTSDVEIISSRQESMRENHTLAILFDADIMEYNSNSPGIDSLTIWHDDMLVGFVKRYNTQANIIKTLYCESRETVIHVIGL